MKTTILKMKYFLLATLVFFSFSCSPEDGAPGPQGEQGIAGINGQDGQNGQDGNANVQTYTFDASEFVGDFDSVGIPELTEDVLNNDAILVYLKTSAVWFPVPCPVDTYGFDHAVDVNLSVGLVEFDYSDGTGANVNITAGDLESGKLIIIESSNTTARSPQANLDFFMETLEAEGIDIKNYHQVCDYLNIAY